MTRLLRRAVAALLIGLLVWTAWSQRAFLAEAFAQVTVGRFLLILAVTLPLYPLAVAAWLALLRGVGGKLTYRQALAVWMLSNAARLLPGTVWQWIGRVYLAEQYGVTKTQTLVSVGYEIALLVVSSGAIALIGLPFWPVGITVPWWVSLVGVASLAFLWPTTLPWLVRLYSKLRKQPLTEVPILPMRALLEAIGYTLLRTIICNGLALWLLVDIFHPTTPSEIIGLAGIYLLAWLVGYVTIIAPGGVGVADASLAGLVGARTSLAAGSAVALLFRVILFVNELVVTGVAVALQPDILTEVRKRAPK